jgi:arylformamidase
MKWKRVHDLSHTILPGKEEYRLDLDKRFTEAWPQFAQYRRHEGEWYVISEITMNTHVGTHIEFPHHHFENGLDAATFPLERLVGEAVAVDISSWGNNQEIPLQGLKERAEGLIRPGDRAYFYTGLDRYYRTPRQHHRPWFATDAIRWLAETAKIHVMGVDTSGIEVRNPDGSAFAGQPDHQLLLGAGVALIEYMANLAPLLNRRFLTFILPVKVAGAEAFPVRVLGLEVED